MLPGVGRQPLKKLEPDPAALLRLLERWRTEAIKTGRTIGRIAPAYEAGRDGFWLARWLHARGIEVHVLQPIPVQQRIASHPMLESQPIPPRKTLC